MDVVNIGDEYFTGEDKALLFSITDASDDPQDITGWAISWMVKRRKTHPDADAIVVKTVGSGITLTSPTTGVLSITVSDTDVAAIVGGNLYYHELKRTDAGFETVLSQGQFVLNQAVHE